VSAPSLDLLRTRALARRLEAVLNVSDARAAARRTLPKALFEYVDGGAEDELTLARNERAFHDLTFRPRMGLINAEPKLGTTVLGTPVSMPVLTAPCGGMRLVHPDGDMGVARAAAAAGTIPVVPAAAGVSLEEVAARVPAGPRWFQLYRFHDPKLMAGLVERAQAAGYQAMVMTMDTVVPGNREQDRRNGFSYNMRINARSAVRQAPRLARHPAWLSRFVRDGMPFELANIAGPDGQRMALPAMSRMAADSQSPTWDDVEWVRDRFHGPVVVKGILTADDARRAVNAGAVAVIVSNHGGRQLDGAPATIDVLPEIVAAVGPDVAVLLDSGVRRGNDVLKALAQGARAVLIGRAAAWGLAIGGQAGVERMLDIMRAQILRSMRLMGLTDVCELNAAWVERSR
jgi:isopentenyl diphosphate isomerase/L-lactate dehydrogenase-like FMN-dependent dehydrogenase